MFDNNWKRFITPVNSTSGKIYGLGNTDKVNNSVRVIVIDCNTAIEKLSVYTEHVLFELSENMSFRIKDSSHLLDIIDYLNSMFLITNTILILTLLTCSLTLTISLV